MNKNDKNIINLIFDAGKGECPVRTREAITGESFGELPSCRRPGYVFDGWFTQPDVNGEKITSGDVVQSEQSMTLYAMYTRVKANKKKKSSLRTQKKALIGLLCTVVLLIVGVIVANYIVSIPLPYTDYDGKVYKVKKADGEFIIVDENGTTLEPNQDGYFSTSLGTLLAQDATTGEISEYAVVDVEGIEVAGANKRIMMYAQIKQANVQQISVTNAHGSYTFYTDANGKVQIKGFEDDKYCIAYNKELYAYLCVGAGYPLTMRKLDTEEVLKRGYAEYGLESEVRVDENGNEYDYTPATFTITSKDGVTHTVIIGDKVVSDAGYYCKLADSDDNKAVYIMSESSYGKAIMRPIEELITPMIVYPMSMTTYYNVEDFIISHYGDELDEDGKPQLEIDIAFDFVPMAVRTNTMYSAESFEINEKLFKYKYDGYRLDNDAVSTVLQNLYQTNITRICKLGITDEALAEYGLDDPAHYITYDYLIDENEDGKTDQKITNFLMISARTPQGSYYVASELCNVIAEVNESSFHFLENETIDWLNQYIIWINLAYIKKLDVQSPNYDVTFTLDNSESDQSSNISSANIKLWVNGEEKDYTVPKISASTGRETKEGPVYNFRQFYKSLLYASIGGLTDQGHVKLTEEEMAALRADESKCQLVLTLEAEDIATVTNPDNFTKNNQKTLVYRFYRYSEGKSYLTINGEGEFFVDAAFVEKLISDARRVEVGEPVDATSKT